MTSVLLQSPGIIQTTVPVTCYSLLGGLGLLLLLLQTYSLIN
jgi:hypothetical protein